jgi:DNA-binding transcriptional MocR family regulator
LPVDKLNRILASIARRKGVQSISYEMANGSEALRIQIARRALAAGCSSNPRELVITSGCQEAVTLFLMAVCRPGDTVAIESPTYFNHLQTLEVLPLKAIEIPSHPASGISLEHLGAALEKHRIRACLLIPNFSNPLGSLMPDDKKQALTELIARHDLPPFQDPGPGVSNRVDYAGTFSAEDRTAQDRLHHCYSHGPSTGRCRVFEQRRV